MSNQVAERIQQNMKRYVDTKPTAAQAARRLSRLFNRQKPQHKPDWIHKHRGSGKRKWSPIRSELILSWEKSRYKRPQSIPEAIKENLILEIPVPLQSGYNNGDALAILEKLQLPIMEPLLSNQVYWEITGTLIENHFAVLNTLDFFDDSSTSGGIYWLKVIEQRKPKPTMDEHNSYDFHSVL